MNLVHLVSEQSLQNLLPLVALRPARVIQIRSADERFARAAAHLRAAAVALARTPPCADLRPEFFEVVIPENSPSVDATRRKVGETLALWPGAVVNLTGGTKLMSIGAWLSAEYQYEPILYCDTPARRFLFLGKAKPPPIASFDEAVAHLTIEAVLAAHGLDPAAIRLEETRTEAHAFAGAAGQHAPLWKSWVETATAPFFDGPAGRLLSKAKMRAALQVPLPLPPSELTSAVIPAITAGILRWSGERPCLCPDPATFTGNSDRLLRAAEDNLRLMRGGWFEYVVERALAESGNFTEVRRGLATPRETALGETDLLAFDSRAFALVAVSCKTDVAHLHALSHLSELHDRARRLGGTFARAALVLLACTQPGKLADLVAFARALGLAVYIGNPAQSRPTLAAPDLPDPLHWATPLPPPAP